MYAYIENARANSMRMHMQSIGVQLVPGTKRIWHMRLDALSVQLVRPCSVFSYKLNDMLSICVHLQVKPTAKMISPLNHDKIFIASSHR